MDFVSARTLKTSYSPEAGMPMNFFQTSLRRFSQLIDFMAVAAGALAGLFLVSSISPLRLILGTNPEVDAAMVLTAALCCWLTGSATSSLQKGLKFYTYALPCAAVWTLLLPSLLTFSVWAIGGLSLDSLTNSVVTYPLMFVITAACLTPVILAIRLSYDSVGRHRNHSQRQWLLGLALPLMLLPTLVLPYIGTTLLTWIGAILSGLWWSLETYRPSIGEENLPVEKRSVFPQRWTWNVVALLMGVSLALTVFMTGQLIPRNLTTDLALIAGLVIGMALAPVFRSRKGADLITGHLITGSSIVLCLSLAAWTGIVTAGFPLWTEFCLRINAWVESVSLLMALRIGFLVCLALPAGFILRQLITSNPDKRAGNPATSVLIAIGFMAAYWIPFSPHLLALGVISSALLLALIDWATERFRIPTSFWARCGYVSLFITALTGALFSGNLNPQNSEKILFSSNTLQSVRRGIGTAQLNWIDDGRPVAEFSTLQNHLSLWKYRGSQLLLRRNGMISGLYSTSPQLCPHNAGDLLPMLMPLVMHPDPEHVLVLGMHPPTLLTCHTWPLRSVRTVDGASAAEEMLNWLTAQQDHGLNLQHGPQFQLSNVDPALSLYSHHELKYDLITCPLLHPSAVGADSRITREFYRGVRSHLQEDGIFSQRIPYYDLGPKVIQELVRTLDSVFGDVSVVESIPGELVFLCSTKKLPAFDDELVQRLKLPQCRTLLGQAGWDWSLILGRGGLDHTGLQKICGPRKHVNRGSSSPLAFWLPIEVSRWGRKGEATRHLLSKYGDALRALLGETAGAKEVSERLEDLNLAHQIQRDHPNEPWAYRAALKSRLQDRPRSTIMQVNHELKRVMAPEDKRRKEYLLRLGPVAQNPHPDAREVSQLVNFAFPYDPLVSMFVHYETSHLLKRCDPPFPAMELQHLLHTVYFATGNDQSVRNIADALELIGQNEDLITEPHARWDQVNSLMQVLAQRWQLRFNSEKPSLYERVDTESSIKATEAGLEILEKDFANAGLTPAEWASRKLTLEQILVRPLNQHRSEQIRHPKSIPIAPPSDKDTQASSASNSSR